MIGGIAVFGAGGQVGSALARRAHERRVKLELFAHKQVDITDPKAVTAALRDNSVGVAINAAAYTAVDKAESESDRAFAINRDGAGALAQACSTQGAQLIHLSTDYVFDGTKQGAYSESDPIAPLGVYGRSKAEGEVAVVSNAPDSIILRTAWVYGLEGANFIKTMLRLGAEREVVRVVNDQSGSPTYADDLADQILTLVDQRQRATTGVYHLAGQGKATWFEVAREIFAETGRRGLRTPRLEAITTAEYPTPAKRPTNSVLDCSLIERDFGIALPDWRDALGRMLTAHLGAAQ
ncbi:MAG: dTDP-4-dehydrorhamnose reductase [Alphaproteobacteria bacterium]|nr:dTDP-4-dehydrorhamnose reductase [Alphaproteobacteria bacterium]